MATKISTELLFMILNNVRSLKDLYSSLLVNRIWCKVTIPLLWELPLGQEYSWWDMKLREKAALCIRTYISCMNTQARTLLIQNGFDLSSSPPQAIFDYPSFTHKFLIFNLVYYSFSYSRQIISPDQDNNNDDSESRKLLFREIFKLIINRCSFLDYLELSGPHSNFPNFFLNVEFIEFICSILKLPGAPKVFKKLETFVMETQNDDETFRPIYELLSLLCDNILNMNLKFCKNSNFEVQLFAKFISVQKRLENLSITSGNLDCNSLLWAIVNQKETLKSIRLQSVNLRHFKGKSSPIEQSISLQELYIDNCRGLHKSDSFASSFTQLSSFHFRHIYKEYPQEFIIKIFETANTKLRKIYLYPCTTDTFSAILNYCTKITELTLLNLCPEQVIAIFNNFNELKIFSFSCRKRLDANKLLCQMAENVPKSLETIEIEWGSNDEPWRFIANGQWIFSADSLRKFFEGWCCKGGGGNKKIIVEPKELFTLSDEHFKVLEEYGVQFDIKKYSQTIHLVLR